MERNLFFSYKSRLAPNPFQIPLPDQGSVVQVCCGAATGKSPPFQALKPVYLDTPKSMAASYLPDRACAGPSLQVLGFKGP